MARLAQSTMSRGEIAPGLHGRVDLAMYQTALRSCQNFIVRREGGVTSRPGLRHVVRSGDDTASRLIRFVWSTEQSYLVEFGVGKAWFTANGARLTVGEPVTDITAVTSATENGISAVSVTPTYFQVQTYIPHGWATGQRVRIYGVTGTGEIGAINDEHVITVVGASIIRVPRQTSGAATWTSGSTGRVAAFVEVATPYTADDLRGLRVAQEGDVLTVTSRNHPVHELRRTSARAFSFVEREYSTGPFQRENQDEGFKVHASAETGAITLTANRDLFTADMVGTLVRLEARERSDAVWEPTSAVSIGARRRYEANSYLCTGSPNGVNTGTSPPTHTFGRQVDGSSSASKEWLYLHSGWGVARITGYTSPTVVSAVVTSRLPAEVVGGATTALGPAAHVGDGTTTTFSIPWATSDDPSEYEATIDGVMLASGKYSVSASANTITFVTPPAAGAAISVRQLGDDNRTDLWRLGAWGGDQGYPGSLAYHGNRLVFGGTPGDPQRYDATRVDFYDEFDPSTPGLDDDPFERRLASRESSRILDLTEVGDLFALTAGGTYRITSGGQAITPTTVRDVLHHAWGAADIPATTVGKAAVYVQRGRTKIRELAQVDDQTFEGAELTVTAGHLFDKGLRAVAMDYAEEPFGTLWVVRSDGVLLSLTYLRDQDVLGWARHVTDGAVRDVCVLPEGDDDVVYVTVERTVKGVVRRFIERFTDRAPARSEDLVCLDASLSFSGRNTGSTTLTLSLTFGVEGIAASASIFAPTDVGRVLIIYTTAGPVRLTVTAYSGPTAVVVSADRVAPDGTYGVPTAEWAWTTSSVAGLAHLAGATVRVRADGAPLAGTFTVTGGGTLTLPEPAAVVHVGLPYEAAIETLEVNIVNQTVRHRAKLVPKVAVLVAESQGLSAATVVGQYDDVPGREVDDNFNVPAPYTGLWEVDVESTWEDTGRVILAMRDPAPLSILALMPEVRVGKS